jgi:hypothetical protein
VKKLTNPKANIFRNNDPSRSLFFPVFAIQ